MENTSQTMNVSYKSEMEEAYIAYAMSVITQRAIPDARDGLKPVHRRILYSMGEMGVSPQSAYKKSARIVGDVLGKYHPHGDSSIYEAMVKMAQPFSMRLPLVDGHGNFGSIDGDGAAAMRYTEAKMTHAAMNFLNDLDKDVVDFVENFDGTLKEPKVLPCKLPNLLINGTNGIAVGMATCMLPNNPGEVLDAAIAVLKDKDISIKKLMKYVKGFDFPTGGEIVNGKNLESIYATGTGKVFVRGVADIKKIKGRLGYRDNSNTLHLLWE